MTSRCGWSSALIFDDVFLDDPIHEKSLFSKIWAGDVMAFEVETRVVRFRFQGLEQVGGRFFSMS